MNSHKKIYSVECDECNHTWSVELWPLIADGDDEDAIQMICDGIFFEHSCPNCGHRYQFVDSLIYYDREKKTMICYVDSVMDLARVYQTLEDTAQEIKNLFEEAVIRVATSQNEFREKIMLHRDGLDDRIIELMKYWALQVLRGEGHNQEFEDIRCSLSDEKKLCIDFIGSDPRCLILDMGFYEKYSCKMLEMINKEDQPIEVNQDWAVDFSERNNC